MKKHLKRLFLKKIILYFAPFLFVLALIFGLLFFVIASSSGDGNEQSDSASDVVFDGTYNSELPLFKEIKGRGPISDEIAQYAVGTAIKYRLLPSVILSQYAYESEWGRSLSARNDNNFFGITWFAGAPFPKGTARGIGGSEGGNYMKFPDSKNAFSYYGYMVASQSNFNQSVGLKSPEQSLLILGRGGYAAAGITESSPYFTGAMSIIHSNNLTEYDDFAIKRWGTFSSSKTDVGIGGWSNPVKINYVITQEWDTPDFWSNGANGIHGGIDIAPVPAGSQPPIYSANNGVVDTVTSDPIGGNYVVINHDNKYYTYYGHLSSISVKVGQKVDTKTIIGTMGSTGASTGAHLHFEVWQGKKWNRMNPRTHIKF